MTAPSTTDTDPTTAPADASLSGDPSEASSAAGLAEAIGPILEQALAPFVERLSAVEGRQGQFGRDLGKVRGKVRKATGEGATPKPTGEDPGDGEGRSEPESVTPEDLGAALRLGRVLEKLPAKARDAIQGKVDSGELSYTDALDRASLLQEHLPAIGTDHDNPEGREAPAGKPETGARSTTGLQFSSWGQWQKFKAENPKAARRYQHERGADFSPSRLPGGPKHGR